MADHGMLFVDALALEILEGRKVETRRPCTPMNSLRGSDECTASPGDVLWVREAWRLDGAPTAGLALAHYRAGGAPVLRRVPGDVHDFTKWHRTSKSGAPAWTPSLLMPRWATRTERGIVAVRREQLDTLTDVQAHDEGFGSPAEFSAAWDAIYGPKGMAIADRPWVWVIRFADRSE